MPFRVITPNMITLMALCPGLTAIRLAFEGKFELAVGCIVAAALLDGIDGRVARYLKGTSRFGAELDSLADFVNFGVVPALVLYFWGLHDLQLARLDRLADLRHRHGAAARPLQRHARRPQSAGLEDELLRRHAGAGRRADRAAADLSRLPRLDACAAPPRRSSCSTCCSSPS